MMTKIEKPEKGTLLIAETGLTGNASFSRAIIFITEHNNDEGSVGFVLNKKTRHYLSDVLPEVQKNFNLYMGGPVERDNLYYIHKVPEQLPGSIEVVDGVFWGGDFGVLKNELRQGNIPEDKIKFFMGYSGWMPLQLEAEIKANSWIVLKEQYRDIFQVTDASTWKAKLKELGGKYLLWANSPENPNFN